MSENQLTESQKSKIEELRNEWLKEIAEIPENTCGNKNVLSHLSDPYIKLHKKYTDEIKRIKNE